MRKILPLLIIVLLGFGSIAYGQGTDIGSEVTSQFSEAIKKFGTQIEAYAERLFWSLAAISLVWTGAMLALRKADLMDFFAELVRFIVTTGFFYWLLTNGTAIAASIITSLQQAGATVGGGAGQGNTVLQLALAFSHKAVSNASVWDLKTAPLWALIAIIGVVLGCYLVVTIIIAGITALTLVYAGVFVLGFGGSKYTSEIAISYYKAVVAAGLRLFTLNLLMNTAIQLVTNAMNADMGQIDNALSTLALLVIVAMLVDKVPAMVAGLVSHNHIGGPGSAVGTLTGATSLAAQGVAAAATSGASLAASGGNAVKKAAMRAVAAMRK